MADDDDDYFPVGIQENKTAWVYGRMTAPPEVGQALRRLLDGTEEPPGLLRPGELERLEPVARMAQMIVEEFSRQFDVCMCSFLVRRTKDNGMETAFAAIDPEGYLREPDFEAVSYLYGRYVQGSHTNKYGSERGEREARVFPDLDKDGRPCLAPRSPDWKVERQNIIIWKEGLWLWQGGEGGLAWEAMGEDINSGGSTYIDRARLPEHLLPWRPPSTWDAETTFRWSDFLRRFNASTGQLNPGHEDSAWQYRTITRSDGSVSHVDEEFRTEISPYGREKLWYSPDAMLYARRMALEKRRESTRVSAIFSDSLKQAMGVADDLLPGGRFDRLREALRKYESLSPAPAPDAVFSDRPPGPITYVIREPAEWDENANLPRYPPAYTDIRHADWDWWTMRSFFVWLRGRPFTDGSTGLLYGGYNGMVVAVVAALHVLHNMSCLELMGAERFDQLLVVLDEIQLQVDESLGMAQKRAPERSSASALESKSTSWTPNWQPPSKLGAGLVAGAARMMNYINPFSIDLRSWSATTKEQLNGNSTQPSEDFYNPVHPGQLYPPQRVDTGSTISQPEPQDETIIQGRLSSPQPKTPSRIEPGHQVTATGQAPPDLLQSKVVNRTPLLALDTETISHDSGQLDSISPTSKGQETLVHSTPRPQVTAPSQLPGSKFVDVDPFGSFTLGQSLTPAGRQHTSYRPDAVFRKLVQEVVDQSGDLSSVLSGVLRGGPEGGLEGGSESGLGGGPGGSSGGGPAPNRKRRHERGSSNNRRGRPKLN